MQTSLSSKYSVSGRKKKKKEKKYWFLLLFDTEDESACDRHVSVYNVTDQSLMEH